MRKFLTIVIKTVLGFPMFMSPVLVLLWYLLGAYVVAGFFHCMDGNGITGFEYFACFAIQVVQDWVLIPISLISSVFGYMILKYL